MIDILNRWTGAVLYHSETADTIAQAVEEAVSNRASLDGASLDGASLDGASLVGARLVGARLDGASLDDIKELPLLAMLQIQGTRHFMCVWSRKLITIGCERHSLAWWLKHFENTGSDHNYTPDQIAEYGEHLRYAERWIEMREKVLAGAA